MSAETAVVVISVCVSVLAVAFTGAIVVIASRYRDLSKRVSDLEKAKTTEGEYDPDFWKKL